jgi:hypothetical protein
MKRIVTAAVFSVAFFATMSAHAASQPQTITICRNSSIPPGWLIIKEVGTTDCSTNPYTNTGSPNAYVITPTPQVVTTTPSPWSYQMITATTNSLTLLRWNNQSQQLCKVSVNAGAAAFACADVTANIITLAELLKR